MSQTLSFRRIGLSVVLFFVFVTHAIPAAAAPHRIQKRDIFSDIANFFDNLEMQVDMTVFQPIANFFTEAVNDFEDYVVQPAENFFMQANTVVVAALYNIDMLVDDIGKAIESQIISDVVSIENLAVQVTQQIESQVETVFTDVQNEFNNVITPALANVGKEIGQAFSQAGADIVNGLDVAGQYLEDHPELIAEIVLTVALGAITVVQPELAGADGALIGEIATEAASGVAGDLLGGLASDAVDVSADFILDDAADEVVEEADMTLFEMISGQLDMYTNYIDNVGHILDFANDVNSTLGDIETLAPVTQQTINDIQAALNPLSAASSEVGGVYDHFSQVVDWLNTAGKIVALVARSESKSLLEVRKMKEKATSTSLSSSLSATPSDTRNTASSTGTSTAASSTASTTRTLVSPPSALISQYVNHHFLSTNTSRLLAKLSLKNSLKAYLAQPNTTTPATYLSYMPQALSNKNLTNTIPYPPTVSAHLNAISHQIGTGGAVAYNAKNMTVRIQMNPNGPTDPCLGVPISNCFGNQLGNPYCLHSCASRWYNKMNIDPIHY